MMIILMGILTIRNTINNYNDGTNTKYVADLSPSKERIREILEQTGVKIRFFMKSLNRFLHLPLFLYNFLFGDVLNRFLCLI